MNKQLTMNTTIQTLLIIVLALYIVILAMKLVEVLFKRKIERQKMLDFFWKAPKDKRMEERFKDYIGE